MQEKQNVSSNTVSTTDPEEPQIIYRASYLIRPPRDIFEFTYIHGIRWNDGLLSSFRPQRGQQSRRGTS